MRPVSLRIVIVGPGRVGTAFAKRFVANGALLLGFVGRDRQRTEAAARAAGAGGVLAWTDLPRAHVVVFAVGDEELPAALAAAAATAGPRPCALWLHTSGRHDLSVFDAVGARGIRRGSLHPVAPFADASSGALAMPGAPGVIAGEPRSRRLLHRLCELLDLVPVWSDGGDRALYHAACALAANGATALFALATAAFRAAGGIGDAGAAQLTTALMRAAAAGSFERGPAAALSGPVRRGDAATVSLHVEALRARAPAALPAYLALARAALDLARGGGLAAERSAAVAAVLDAAERGRI